MGDDAGYSGTPLIRKLGIEAGMRLRLVDPPGSYWELLGGDPESLDVTVVSPEGDEEADVTHVFATDRETLAEGFRLARATMREDGMAWASWPKKSSGVPSEIDRSDVMAAGKEAGLVDVKVCAVDETWSGLKFVIPLEDRTA